MPKAKVKVASLGGTAQEVETAFYEALQNADLDKLMACWSDEDEVVCIHPGGMRRVGVHAIRDSFENIFSGGALRVNVLSVKRVDSLTSAMHNVLEQLEVMLPNGPQMAYVYATNVYQRTPQGWRMVLHHASPGNPDEVQQDLELPAVLH